MPNVQSIAVLHGVHRQAQKCPHLLPFHAQVMQPLQEPGFPSDYVQDAAAGGRALMLPLQTHYASAAAAAWLCQHAWCRHIK